jgi:cytochrome c oxidase cbb3-type subunit III
MATLTTREHTFDGIQEFDNRLPNWWLWSLYLACIYSLGYWVWYHTIGVGEQPSEAYMSEQRAAAARLEAQFAANPVTDELLLKIAKEPAFVEQGAAIFKDPMRCALCHKPDGSGLIGPNLTDDRWIYGSRPMEVYASIAKGRPRGMLAHESFGTGFVQRATAYVLSIRNTNLPGKEPEPDAKKDP